MPTSSSIAFAEEERLELGFLPWLVVRPNSWLFVASPTPCVQERRFIRGSVFPNSSKIQNTDPVASLNNPPSNQNPTSSRIAPAWQTFSIPNSALRTPYFRESPTYIRKQRSAGTPADIPSMR